MKTVSLLLLLPVFLCAAEALDFDMTPQERKDTGISRLSSKEKAALQQWIDTHYQKREQPAQQPAAKTHPQISENLQNGQYLRLTDGSLWNIRPKDTLLTQSWITPADIIITQSGDPSYPYKLTNSLTGSSVYAKKAESTYQ